MAWLEGAIAVRAAIEAQSREVEAVYIRRGKWRREVGAVKKTAVSANIPVRMVDDAFISQHASGKSHGGVLAKVGPRRFVDLSDLLTGSASPFIVMLDGIEDPFNFGQAVRTLYAAGVDGLVVRPRNWLTAVSVVARSSAGASERIPMAVAETAVAAATYFKAHGLAIACTSRENAVSLFDADLTQSLFLLIGGERRGITRSFLAESDLRLEIPYGRSFAQSLGTVASASVVSFELLRQRTS
ncbi:MAG: RNA methyltransferase [Chloroflexota bacterium]